LRIIKNKTLSLVRKTIRIIAVFVDLSISGILTLFLLIRHINEIRNADHIVLCISGGHGHTVTMPDVARRILIGRTFLIFLSEAKRHNWEQAQIWNDLKMVHFPKSIKYRSSKGTKIMASLVLWIVVNLMNKNVILSKDAPEKKYKLLGKDHDLLYRLLVKKIQAMNGHITQPVSTPTSNDWMVYMFHAIQCVPKKKPIIPERIKLLFLETCQHNFSDKQKFITIYMRKKGDLGKDSRWGGGFEDYHDVVHFLDENDYRILLLGDRNLTECPEDIKSFFWDAKRFGFDQNWFNVLAVSECERFIGDPGGGSWLHSIFEKPGLIVNAFPYSLAIPQDLLLFKRLLDEKGTEVSLSECFSDRLWSYDFPEGYSLRNNTPNELLDAVKELVSIPLDEWCDYIKPQPIFANGSWAVEAPSRLVQIQDS
jgi:putative glycosyltransferase (TIGR04372 family)